MVKFENKVELSGLIVLFIGVILLIFTFLSAYFFLIGELNIIATDDLLRAFGEALAPLIEAIIRVLFLAIMGWIGSIITIRAVQLLKQEKPETPQNPPQQEQQQSTKAEPKQAATQTPSVTSPRPDETKPTEASNKAQK